MLVALDYKAEGGELAGAVADNLPAVVGKAKENISEIEGLITGKAGTNPQIDFLSYSDSLSQISIRFDQVLYCMLYILLR